MDSCADYKLDSLISLVNVNKEKLIELRSYIKSEKKEYSSLFEEKIISVNVNYIEEYIEYYTIELSLEFDKIKLNWAVKSNLHKRQLELKTRFFTQENEKISILQVNTSNESTFNPLNIHINRVDIHYSEDARSYIYVNSFVKLYFLNEFIINNCTVLKKICNSNYNTMLIDWINEMLYYAKTIGQTLLELNKLILDMQQINKKILNNEFVDILSNRLLNAIN